MKNLFITGTGVRRIKIPQERHEANEQKMELDREKATLPKPKPAGGQPHSKTLRGTPTPEEIRQVLECGCPLPLFPRRSLIGSNLKGSAKIRASSRRLLQF